MHIIVVEDNLVLAKSILRVLKQEGYSATHFADGAVASSWLSTHIDAYDLVMLDVLLPNLDGFSIAQALRINSIKKPVLPVA